MRINRTPSGENLYRILASKVFINTDLPEPVVPATRDAVTYLNQLLQCFQKYLCLCIQVFYVMHF